MLINVFGRIINPRYIIALDPHLGDVQIVMPSNRVLIKNKTIGEVHAEINRLTDGLPVNEEPADKRPVQQKMDLPEPNSEINRQYILDNLGKLAPVIARLGGQPAKFATLHDIPYQLLRSDKPTNFRSYSIDRAVRAILELKAQNLSPIRYNKKAKHDAKSR